MVPNISESSGINLRLLCLYIRDDNICTLYEGTRGRAWALGSFTHFTSPGSSCDMLYTRGSTSRGNIRMIVSVVISSATRVCGFRVSRSIPRRQPTTYRGPLETFTMNFSSLNFRSTSPMICPTLCSAFRSSSVFSYFALSSALFLTE